MAKIIEKRKGLESTQNKNHNFQAQKLQEVLLKENEEYQSKYTKDYFRAISTNEDRKRRGTAKMACT